MGTCRRCGRCRRGRKIGDGIDCTVTLERIIAGWIAQYPVERRTVLTGTTDVEPGPFGPFGYLVVDIIDGDCQATLVAACDHATIVIPGRYRDNP